MACDYEQVIAMSADPKWLEILKASGWKTAALTGAAALVLYLNATKWFRVPLDSWMIQAAEVSVVVFGFHAARTGCNYLWLAVQSARPCVGCSSFGGAYLLKFGTNQHQHPLNYPEPQTMA